jgi:hypothetical protein
MDQLKQRIAALEAKLGKKAEGDEECDGSGKLAAEIAALETRLADDDEDDDGKKASEVDPSGIEEQITTDKFSEVERIQHGEELATGPSMGAVAPTRSEYVAKLRSASVRLDKVAEYLENNGRRALAYRVDKIADAIDARIKGGK